jgi:hypothetical protein
MSAIQVLEQLAGELAKLPARLDSAGDGAWRTSWTRCQELLARYKACAPDPKELSPKEARRLAQALADVLKRNAVVTGIAARTREALGSELQGLTVSRRRVREASLRASPGAQSCDLQG